SRSRAYLETVERHCTNNDFEALSSFLEKPRKVFSSAETSALPAEYQEIVKSKGLSATDVGYWFNLPTTPFRHLLIATDGEGKIKWWGVYRA
ncbi:MAG TPA: hypothetical protein PLA50_11365, partial [Bacteroidia bacterium]|nr:hypothetical protein [Bacteroidia bacterium]